MDEESCFTFSGRTDRLDNKDVERTVEYRDKLLPEYEQLKDERFDKLTNVQDFFKQADPVFKRLETELGQILAGMFAFVVVIVSSHF